MSRYCGKYPGCGCVDIGTKCYDNGSCSDIEPLKHMECVDVCQAAMEQIKYHDVRVLVIDEDLIGRAALVEKIATRLTTTSTITIEEAREYINGVVVISDQEQGDTIEKLKIEAEKLYADKVADNYDYNEKAVIRQQRQENRYRAKHFRKL